MRRMLLAALLLAAAPVCAEPWPTRPLTSTPEAMRAQQIADMAKWREIVQRSGARAE